jgi:hypothetical protein
MFEPYLTFEFLVNCDFLSLASVGLMTNTIALMYYMYTYLFHYN